MSWKDRFGQIKSMGETVHERGVELGEDAIERHWPGIRDVLRERVAPTVEDGLANDALVEKVAKTLHGLLPLPVRLVIRPARLTQWCLDNRERVLSVIQHPERS